MQLTLTAEEFEKVVAEGINAIPDEFLAKLKNVAIVIADEPTVFQKQRLISRDSSIPTATGGWTLFGLYEGVPQTIRAANYSGVPPDKITIFQKPIERAARDLEDLRQIVCNTVWHEIAHHFGMDEHSVRHAEQVRRDRKN